MTPMTPTSTPLPWPPILTPGTPPKPPLGPSAVAAGWVPLPWRAAATAVAAVRSPKAVAWVFDVQHLDGCWMDLPRQVWDGLGGDPRWYSHVFMISCT